MRRRDFIGGVGSAAAWPVVARAQQQTLPVIGVLSNGERDRLAQSAAAPSVGFLQALKETSYVEGQNVAIEYRSSENQLDRLPALAADLVRRRVAVIVALGTNAALAVGGVLCEAPTCSFAAKAGPLMPPCGH